MVSTTHFVRADHSSSGNASVPHVVDEKVEKHAWAFPQEEAPRHIARVNEPSTRGEALELLHLPTGLLQEDEDLTVNLELRGSSPI